MKLPEDQQVLQGLLRETITLLCKNGLQYNRECSVEALIVVTLDQDKMFHTNIQQIVGKDDVSDDDGEEPTFGMYPGHGGAVKRRRMQADVREVPSKRSVRLTRGEDGMVQKEGMEYVVQDNFEEEVVEDAGKEDEGHPQEFRRDLRNASQMSVEYTEVEDEEDEVVMVERGEGKGVVIMVPEGTSLKTTEQDEVQVIQHMGMKLPTEPDTDDSDRGTLKVEKEEDTEEDRPVVKRRLAKPRGQPGTMAMRKTRSGQLIVKGSEPHQGVAEVEDKTTEENGEREMIEQIQEGGVKVDPADQETIEFIRELETEVEIAPSTASTKRMGEPEMLRKIISSAVDKVRKEVATTANTTTTTTSSSNMVVTHIKSATPVIGSGTIFREGGGGHVTSTMLTSTPKEEKPKMQSDHLMGDHSGRGRPSSLPVTTTPKGTQVAVHKPLISMESANEQQEMLHVSSPQPIKVLYGLAGKKKNKTPKICNTCGQMFTSLQSLSDHQCGEKNLFQCGICSAMFIRKENLKKHFEEHREEVEVSVLHNQ